MCLLCVSMIGMSAWGETSTYQHVFTAKPSTGNNKTLSGVAWNIAATNLNGYNSDYYAGVQIGSSKTNGSITLTSASDWNYNSKAKITEVRLWLNLGGTSVTPTVTIGGKSATSDGTTVVKNTSAGTDWTKATKVTFTPAADGNTGVVVINVATVKAGYICAMEIDCEEAPSVPTVSATTPAKLAYDATGGSISYSVSNPVAGGVVTAESSESWLTIGAVSASDVTFTCTTNGATVRSATVTLTYTYNTSETVTKEVTVTQARYVSAVASLPFAFDGKRADIEETDGLTQAGIDASDYASSPYLKFKNQGTNLVLRLTERPGTLSFDIKGMPSDGDYAEGTFQIQTSADGVTYDNYRTITNISKDLQSIEYVGFDANVRYIKWIYSAKTSGNVALGNIKVSATYNRATSAGSYGTLCLPYDATVEGAKLYTIAGKEITGSEVTAIVLEEAGSAKAGNPYIFKATADDVVATFTGSMYAASGAVNGLHGTYGAIAAGEWDTYVSGDLYLMTASNVQAANKETSTLGANRAYIDMNTVSVYDPSAGVKGIRLGFDGTEEATAITELTEKTETTEGVIYNLQGQRMNSLQRGINIVNGKKVLVK